MCLASSEFMQTQAEDDDIYYDDGKVWTERRKKLNEEKAYDAIYWHYVSTKKRVRKNERILRLDLSHRMNPDRNTTYKFNVRSKRDVCEYWIHQRGVRRPRAFLKLKNRHRLRGGRADDVDIEMKSFNDAGKVLDKVLIKAQIFVSKFNF